MEWEKWKSKWENGKRKLSENVERNIERQNKEKV